MNTLGVVARGTVAFTLMATGAWKMRNGSEFSTAASRILNRAAPISRVWALFLGATEIGLGLTMFAPGNVGRISSAAALAMILLFSLLLLRRRHDRVPCGCWRPGARETIKYSLVRNTVLLLASFVAASATGPVISSDNVAGLLIAVCLSMLTLEAPAIAATLSNSSGRVG